METPQHDPNNRPQQGAALFRWILEQRKLEEANPSQEELDRREIAIRELRKRNAERGTPIVRL